MKRDFGFLPLLLLPALIIFAFACAQNTPEAVFHRGIEAYEQGDMVSASLFFDDFVTRFPDDERALGAYTMLARSYMNLRDTVSARRVYEEMSDRFPEPDVIAQCNFSIAHTYMEEGNFESAETIFRDVVESATDPEIRMEALGGLAGVFHRQSKNDIAVTYMDQIYLIGEQEIEDPTMALRMKITALNGRAQISMASDEFEAARNAYERQLDLVKDATTIPGIEEFKQNAVLNWAHTFVAAGDYVAAASTYEQLLTNKYMREEIKPQLIVWKIQSLENIVWSDEDKEPTDEEIAMLVREHQRFIDEYDHTDYGINARVQIAALIKDSSPEESDRLLQEAVERYQRYIAEPPTAERALIAMLQIAQAYIAVEKWDEAEQAVNQIRSTYSDIPQALQQAHGMMEYIRHLRSQPEGAAVPTGADAIPGVAPPAASGEGGTYLDTLRAQSEQNG